MWLLVWERFLQHPFYFCFDTTICHHAGFNRCYMMHLNQFENGFCMCVCVWREKEIKIGQNTFIETELYMQPVHLKIILSWYSWGESCTFIKLAPVNFSVVQQQDRAFQLKWPRVHCEDDAEECEVLFFQSHLSHKETCMLYIFQVYL